MPHELNASIQVTLPDDPRAMAMAIAKVGPDATWQALVAAAHAWAEYLDQWDKFKFQTDHGLVYVSIGRAAECPDAQLAAAQAETARLRHILTAIRDNAADPETVLANVDAALTGGTDAG